jgi:hypothetical protein
VLCVALLLSLAAALVPVGGTQQAGGAPGARRQAEGGAEPSASDGSSGAAEAEDAEDADAQALSIASVSPWVEPDGEFQVRFHPSPGVPADAQLTVTIHQAIDPDDGSLRRALADILNGAALGRILRAPITAAFAELGNPAEGALVRIPVRSGRADSDRIFVPNAGIHPVELVLTAPDGPELWSHVVFLNRLPEPPEERAASDDDPDEQDTDQRGAEERGGGEQSGDETGDEERSPRERPPVRVTLLLPVSSAPPIAADGSARFTVEEQANLGSVAALLTDAPDAPLTIAARPNTLDGLTLSPEPWSEDALAPLTADSPARAHLALPYTGIDTGGLVESGDQEELTHQIDLGRATVERITGRAPLTETWALDDTVTPGSLVPLARAGIRSVLLPAELLQLPDDLTSEDVVARPVELLGDSGLRALAYDGVVSGLLAGTQADPGGRANEVVSMLMATWFDESTPDSEHGPASVVLVTSGTDPELLKALTPSLTGDGPLRAEAGVSPLPPRDPDSADEVAGLTARRTTDQSGVATAARDTRRLTDAYRSMVGEGDPLLWAWQRIVDQTVGRGVDSGRRFELHVAVREAVQARVDAIEPPRPRRVLLTSRQQTVPLRFRNDLPFDVSLRMRARSPRLEIEGGDSRRIVLHPGDNRIDLPINVQAPGESLLRVELTSPIPGIALDGPDIPVRSTTISGVGAALSIVSAIFLVGWWVHTNRRERRKGSKLTGGHPSRRGGTGSLPSGG